MYAIRVHFDQPTHTHTTKRTHVYSAHKPKGITGTRFSAIWAILIDYSTFIHVKTIRRPDTRHTMATDDETPMLRDQDDNELDDINAGGCCGRSSCCNPSSAVHRFIALIFMCLLGFGEL